MRKKYVFAFDIDGTIINGEGEILPETKLILRKARDLGHILVLASGRPFFDMIGIAKNLPVFDYLICNNGSYFYDIHHEKFHFKSEVPKNVAHVFYSESKKYKTLLAVHTTKGVYRAKMWSEDPMWNSEEIRKEWHKFELIDGRFLAQVINDERIMQVSLFASDEIITQVAKELNTYGSQVELKIAGRNYLDANPLGTSKLEGIRDLAKHINHALEDFVVFGDSGNDVEMLAGTNHSYCMGNGTEEAKQAARHVIGSNEEPSIASKMLDLII